MREHTEQREEFGVLYIDNWQVIKAIKEHPEHGALGDQRAIRSPTRRSKWSTSDLITNHVTGVTMIGPYLTRVLPPEVTWYEDRNKRGDEKKAKREVKKRDKKKI